MADTFDEPLRAVKFAATDTLLREDVKLLGALVGEILADQRGPEFLAEVERLRRAAIARRETGAPVAALDEVIGAVDPAQASDLVRAFSTYFQAVNIAERVHRIRRRRDHERQGDGAQPGGLRAVLGALAGEGVAEGEMADVLSRLRIEPVFTAHPTEAVRRALLEKERRIVSCLVADIDRGRTPAERAADRERIRLALTASWQTADTPPARPSVSDEFEHVSYYLTDVLYRVLPVYCEALEAALREHFPGVLPPEAEACALEDAIGDVLAFATWVGGDMDGNPNVGAATITATLAAQRARVLGAYGRDVEALRRLLTQSPARVAIAPDIAQRIERYCAMHPDACERLRARDADMPYRNLLTLMQLRLEATAAEAPHGYRDVHEFIDDITLIERSLCQHGGRQAGTFAVRRLQRRARCFGFHLATLDIRQESSTHDAALAAVIGDDRWPTLDAQVRTQRLHALLREPPRAGADAGAATQTLAVFNAIAQMRGRYGARAFGPYIVSMSRSAADALAVLALARIAGCVEDGQVPLDVAPLFETIDDLAAAPATVHELLADPLYREHLAARGNHQIVMLGYSDSAKDGGLLASRWGLQRTQVELTQLAHDSGVRITFFHGRGGAGSPGGGQTPPAGGAGPRGAGGGGPRRAPPGGGGKPK